MPDASAGDSGDAGDFDFDILCETMEDIIYNEFFCATAYCTKHDDLIWFHGM